MSANSRGSLRKRSRRRKQLARRLSTSQNALATLALGQTYRLDIYYYIEGTDPDSADYLYQDPGTLHLALFATLDGE